MLKEWATRWGVPQAAIDDLVALTSPVPSTPLDDGDGSESYVQSAIRLEASENGVTLFRNNVGVLEDATGRPVRYGLLNDTKMLNKRFKSGDLVGIRPILITPAHVGHTIGQFVSREVKAEGWRYTGAGREPAQMRWATLINSKGGDAKFASGLGSFGK